MTMTLTQIASSWAEGLLDDKQAVTQMRTLEWPVWHQDPNDGPWFEGEADNTVAAVQALVGSRMTFEQFARFQALVATV